MSHRSRRRVLPRCARCRMHVPMCVCASLPRIATRTRVVLVPHATEWNRPSNTGRIAILSLIRSELATWSPSLDIDLLMREGHEHWLLHPSGERIAPTDKPVSLIVPDGTWRETSRISRRLLRELRPVRVDPAPSAGLRRAPDRDRVGTCEAIAEALDALGEGEAAIALRRALRLMVDRTLWSRGMLSSELVTGGVSIETRRAMGGASIKE